MLESRKCVCDCLKAPICDRKVNGMCGKIKWTKLSVQSWRSVQSFLGRPKSKRKRTKMGLRVIYGYIGNRLRRCPFDTMHWQHSKQFSYPLWSKTNGFLHSLILHNLCSTTLVECFRGTIQFSMTSFCWCLVDLDGIWCLTQRDADAEKLTRPACFSISMTLDKMICSEYRGMMKCPKRKLCERVMSTSAANYEMTLWHRQRWWWHMCGWQKRSIKLCVEKPENTWLPEVFVRIFRPRFETGLRLKTCHGL